MTRWFGKKPSAITAPKIGTAPWMIAARPESIRVSPQESSQNGSAVLSRPTTTSSGAKRRSSASVRRAPTSRGTTSASVSAPSPMRPAISVAGSSSRTATLMNMNDAPQIRASAASMSAWVRVISE